MKYLLHCLLLISFTNISFANGNILVVGDSLSAGYGMKIEQSWPALLQNRLKQEGQSYQVHNASISGQTTSEGLRQIDQLLKLTQPKVVVLELGANDGLRGLSIPEMKTNLQTMIQKIQQAKAKAILVGIKVPNNYGRRYGTMFSKTFESLANQHQLIHVPFMLAPLETIITEQNRGEYIQADGLHPTAKAQPIILDHLYPLIFKAL